MTDQVQRRLNQETVDDQLWAPDLFDALKFLEGKTINSVARGTKIGDRDEVVILNFADGTFAEFHGLANWSAQVTSIGVAYSDVEGVEM